MLTSHHAGADQTHLFEVTRDEHVVWTWVPRDAGVHHFQILTTSGRAVPGPPLR